MVVLDTPTGSDRYEVLRPVFHRSQPSFEKSFQLVGRCKKGELLEGRLLENGWLNLGNETYVPLLSEDNSKEILRVTRAGAGGAGAGWAAVGQAFRGGSSGFNVAQQSANPGGLNGGGVKEQLRLQQKSSGPAFSSSVGKMSGGPALNSAARSHEQNDAYMQDFAAGLKDKGGYSDQQLLADPHLRPALLHPASVGGIHNASRDGAPPSPRSPRRSPRVVGEQQQQLRSPRGAAPAGVTPLPECAEYMSFGANKESVPKVPPVGQRVMQRIELASVKHGQDQKVHDCAGRMVMDVSDRNVLCMKVGCVGPERAVHESRMVMDISDRNVLWMKVGTCRTGTCCV